MKRIILISFFLAMSLMLPVTAQSQSMNGIHHGTGPLMPSISHQPMTRQPKVMKSNTSSIQLTAPVTKGTGKALDANQSLLNKAFNSTKSKAPQRLSADNVVGDKIMFMTCYDYNSDSGNIALIDNYWQGGWDATIAEELPGVLKATYMYYYLPVTINVDYDAKTAEMEMGTLATFQWSNTVGSTQYDTTQVVMIVNEDYILNAPNGNLTNIPGTLNDEGSLHFTDGYCYYIIEYYTRTNNGNVTCDTISFRSHFFHDTYLMTPNGMHQYDRVDEVQGISLPIEDNVYMYQADDTTAVIWNMWGQANRNMVMYIHEDGNMEFPSLQFTATLDTIYFNENNPGAILRNGAFNYAVELHHGNDSDYIDPWSASAVSTFGTVTPTEITWDASILYSFWSFDEGNTWYPTYLIPYYLHNKLTFTDGSQWFENQEEPIEDGLYYRYEDNGTATVIAGETPYSGDIIIPETTVHDGRTYTVTAIDSIAFMNCTELTSVIIGDSVTSIGFRAFSGCTGMTSISIGKSVNIVRGPAFADCTGLTSVNIKDLEAWCRIRFAYYQAQPCIYAHHLLLNGEEITDLVIPNTITEIKNQAFIGCGGITSVTLHNGITSIGWKSFQGCSLSGDLIIPSSVTHIGGEAFLGCKRLSSITIPNTITTINDGVFSHCSGLTCFEIPNSVTAIGNEAFYVCSNLSSINIPNSVTRIGDRAFANCDSLATIEMPNSVSFIGESAFEYCYALRSIDIPNALTAINNKTFRRCTSLTSITIPNTVTSIGHYAFQECNSLKNIIIGNSVKFIGFQAFEYCYEINDIDIPNSVDSICSGAFRFCI